MIDLIGKASVCEILADIYPTDGESVVDVKMIDKAYGEIQKLPSVQPEHECCECKYYVGVHGVMGHAPCSFWKIGGVLWNDFCSRWERREDG